MTNRASKLHTLFRFGRGVLTLTAATALLVGANWAAHNHNLRWDLTVSRSHSLGPRTLQILGGLAENVKLTAFYPGVAPESVSDLLDEFGRNSGGRVTTELLDPLHNLGYAAQFGNKIDAGERVVYITAGKQRESLDCSEKPLDENRLSAAIYRVATEKRKVYFLKGHNEYGWQNPEADGYSKLATALEELNLHVSGLELSTAGRVPDDCGVLIVGGARSAAGPDEQKEIRRYLDEGGHALFLVESAHRTQAAELTELEKRLNPTWNEVLSDWGVTMGDDVVVDVANHMGQDVGCPATSKYPDHDKIIKGLGITFYVRPRSIAFARPEKRQVLFAPLVTTLENETSWAETDKKLFIQFTPGKDVQGPVTIAAVLMQDPKSWKDGRQTKLVVIGDADFVTNQYTGRYSNLDLVVNSVSWLAQREILLGDENQAPPEARLEMTSRDLKLAVGGLCMVPLAAALLGMAVWVRYRRHAKRRHR